MRYFIIMLAIVGTTLGSRIAKDQLENDVETNVGKQERILSNIILEILERIRIIMREGSDTLPVLDPLRIGPFAIDGQIIGVPEFIVKMDEIVVSNLSTFRILDMNLILESLLQQRYRMEFDIDIPVLNVDTNNYTINVPVFGGQIFGNGDMKLSIVELRTRGIIGISVELRNGSATINDCDIAFSLASFDPEITGMLETEATSQFASTYLKRMVERYLEFYENEINALISIAVKTIGNLILGNSDVTGIITNN